MSGTLQPDSIGGFCQYEPHHGIEKLISRLNALYTGHSALHERDVSPEGFEWIDFTDSEQSVVSYLRKAGGRLFSLYSIIRQSFVRITA